MCLLTNIEDHKGVFKAAQERATHARGLILGYSAFHKGLCSSGFNTRCLPIGEGLLATRIGTVGQVGGGVGHRKRSRWIIKVDEYTGEKHVYRVTSPQGEAEA